MKLIKLFLAISLLSVAGIGNAWADRGHGHGHGHVHERSGVHWGVVIGPVGPYWRPWFSPMHSSYYYPPYPRTVVVERVEPPVYIERQAPTPPSPGIAAVPAPAPQTNYWYYCGASKAYYPYVQECPGGWQKVSPQPPGQP